MGFSVCHVSGQKKRREKKEKERKRERKEERREERKRGKKEEAKGTINKRAEEQTIKIRIARARRKGNCRARMDGTAL